MLQFVHKICKWKRVFMTINLSRNYFASKLMEVKLTEININMYHILAHYLCETVSFRLKIVMSVCRSRKYQCWHEVCVCDMGSASVHPTDSLNLKIHDISLHSFSFFECCAFYGRYSHSRALCAVTVFVFIHLYYLYLAMVTEFVCLKACCAPHRICCA